MLRAAQLLKRNPYRGRLVALDGRDGAGKTTVAQEVQATWAARGVAALIVKLPGEVFHGSALTRAWRGTPGRLRTRCIEQLSGIDRVFVFQELVMPQLDAGVCVILDRFLTASLGKVMTGKANVTDVTHHARHLLMPDVWAWLHCSPRVALSRIKATRVDDPDAQLPESDYGRDLDLGKRVCRFHGIAMIDTTAVSVAEVSRRIVAGATPPCAGQAAAECAPRVG